MKDNKPQDNQPEIVSNPKKLEKSNFKKLSKEEQKQIKQRIKEVDKLNQQHKGEINMPLRDPNNIIELRGVKKIFTNGYLINDILKGVDLDIKRGEFVIILGPSGSGKTTLMNIMSGLDRATEGDVRVCDQQLINMSHTKLTEFRKKNIGFVFQQYGLLPTLTVEENVEIEADLQVDKSRRINPAKALDAVGMLDYAKKFPHELSGGQQQRVSIARALAKNPIILFGDEPTGAVDETMSKVILKEFVKVNKELKTTVIIVTHNPIFAELGTLVIKVRNGEIAELYKNEHPKGVDDLKWDQ
ncbi:ABC transporter ATP-binding protein [Ureaplasma diversum]|uniref:ABC Transporter, ATP-binding protein n=1 Tax=Ureaplasma diversum NCTC 246 TaxID=1188241 RepID=A0A084F1E1_9BACT|nr:ABC transporter ATP-binding protein [Ureaplasma diversum]KEZ24033.1 ABC Transporter, ATP-binding protein [Ureaplasma diversum NCTC 246]